MQQLHLKTTFLSNLFISPSKLTLNLLLIFLHALGLPVKNNKDCVAFNGPKASYSETSEPCGVLNEPWMANYTLENCSIEKRKKKNQVAWVYRKSLHHLPDALCQQVKALIDLRLPNCTVIKERSCSVPFFLLILTLFIWFWRGHSWA